MTNARDLGQSVNHLTFDSCCVSVLQNTHIHRTQSIVMIMVNCAFAVDLSVG